MAATIVVYPHENPRLIVLSTPQATASIQELVDAIRAWEDSQEGMGFDYLIEATGKDFLGAGLYTGITLKLLNAKIQFETRNTVLTSGTITTASSTGTEIHDSVATFTGDSLGTGDTLFNTTTASMSVLLEVESDIKIRMLALIGGSRQDWQVGDGYSVYQNEKCTITGGNLVAVDENGDTMDSMMKAANVNYTIENATSAALLTAAAASASGMTVGQFLALK